jgi:hypothetical protein
VNANTANSRFMMTPAEMTRARAGSDFDSKSRGRRGRLASSISGDGRVVARVVDGERAALDLLHLLHAGHLHVAAERQQPR